jgi:hypothetical protein
MLELGLVFFLTGVITLIVSISSYIRIKRIFKNGVEIFGTAVKTEEVESDPNGNAIPPSLMTTFTYNVEGKEYNGYHRTATAYNEGDKIRIKCPIKEPEAYVIPDGGAIEKSYFLECKVALIISILVILIGIFIIKRAFADI